MKKLVLLVALLIPCVPSFILGVKSQLDTTNDRRTAMLEERFATWCESSGYSYGTMSEAERNNMYDDFWSETDDYLNACDSIDKVLSLRNEILSDK